MGRGSKPALMGKTRRRLRRLFLTGEFAICKRSAFSYQQLACSKNKKLGKSDANMVDFAL